MNDNNQLKSCRLLFNRRGMKIAASLLLILSSLTQATIAAEPGANTSNLTVSTEPSSIELAPQLNIVLGKSSSLRLPAAVTRVSVGDKDIADVILLNPKEVYLLGKKVGATNIMLWNKSGQSVVVDVVVGLDVSVLQTKLNQLLPNEAGIRVSTASDSLVLSGSVSDASKLDKTLMLAEAFGGKKVVNMLKVSAQQQVMLEVKMAEVSKNLLDKLGAQFSASGHTGGVTYAIAAGFLSLTGANPLSPGGLLTITNGKNVIKIDAEKKDGIVKILAEPNIMAISGQEGSFLAGGKIFIPVAQSAAAGASTITLEEKEFGVGLKFTPTVLDGDLINLRVAPEVSELSESGTEIIAGGSRSVLPSFVTRRVSTTVQLHDGQSFAIAGLIRNNVTETIRRFPILGEIPILGALFRSNEFQTDKTELLFVITPRLVKPLPPGYALPTDNFTPPTRKEFFLDGKLEKGSDLPTDPDQPQKSQPGSSPPAKPEGDDSGYELK